MGGLTRTNNPAISQSMRTRSGSMGLLLLLPVAKKRQVRGFDMFSFSLSFIQEADYRDV